MKLETAGATAAMTAAVLSAEPSVAVTVYVPGVEPSVARPALLIELPSLVPVMDQPNVGELMALPN